MKLIKEATAHKFEVLQINNIPQIKNITTQEFFNRGEDVELSILEWWEDDTLVM